MLANSALMFGYARPDWRDGYAGWEYIDTVADDNQRRARAEGAVAPRRGRPDRLRGLRHRAPRSARRSRESEHLTRAGIADGLRRVKQLPGDQRLRRHAHGLRDEEHAALKGHYLVLREWRDGQQRPDHPVGPAGCQSAGQKTKFSLRAVRIAHEIVKRIPANVIASDAPVLIATKVWSGRSTSKPNVAAALSR